MWCLEGRSSSYGSLLAHWPGNRHKMAVLLVIAVVLAYNSPFVSCQDSTAGKCSDRRSIEILTPPLARFYSFTPSSTCTVFGIFRERGSGSFRSIRRSGE